MNDSRVRVLNDHFRTFFVGGQVFMTKGIYILPFDVKQKIIESVKNYRDFTPDNDPYGHHDFGSFEIDDLAIFWKIDYYDINIEYGSEDPSNEDETTRVLTILLSHEY